MPTPNDYPAEQAVLASLALKPELAEDLTARLPAEAEPPVFFTPAHQALYIALLGLAQRLRAGDQTARPDAVTVPAELQRLDLLRNFRGGRRGAEECFEDVLRRLDQLENISNYLAYVDIVRRTWLQRKMAGTLYELADQTNMPQAEVAELLETLDQRRTSLLSYLDRRPAVWLSEALEDLLEELTDRVERARELPADGILGLPSGVPGLTELIGGLKPGELVLVGGDPNEGKSTLLVQIADAVASSAVARHGEAGKGGSLLMSMEQNPDRLAGKILYGEAGIDSMEADAGNLTDDDLQHLDVIRARIGHRRMRIEKFERPTWAELRSCIVRNQIAHDFDAVFLDYIQKLPVPRGLKKNEYMAEVTADAKSMAGQLKVPLVCAAQLSRPDRRGGRKKAPTIQDLADASALEKDSDVIILIHPKGPLTKAEAPISHKITGGPRPHDVVVVDLIVGKHREGRKGVVKCLFDRTLGRFLPPPDPAETFMGKDMPQRERKDLA